MEHGVVGRASDGVLRFCGESKKWPVGERRRTPFKLISALWPAVLLFPIGVFRLRMLFLSVLEDRAYRCAISREKSMTLRPLLLLDLSPHPIM